MFQNILKCFSSSRFHDGLIQNKITLALRDRRANVKAFLAI